MGMYPVGYYDLSPAGVPVHSTAFRPIESASLSRNPFRIFTSLLRPGLIVDTALRDEVMSVLHARDIFHPVVKDLVAKAEEEGGLGPSDAAVLVQKALETFKWHDRSLVSEDIYKRMKAAHPLLADIAAFQGPHINHLTPRVLDIDEAQASMEERGWAQAIFAGSQLTPQDPAQGSDRRTSSAELSDSVAPNLVQGPHGADSVRG